MTVETFFKSFELLADSPGAISTMRKLIFQLAVDGKLLRQNPTDEAANTLIEKAIKMADDENKDSRARDFFDEWYVRYNLDALALPAGWSWTCNDLVGNTSPRVRVGDDKIVAFVPMTLVPSRYGEAAGFDRRPWGEIKKGYTHFADGDVAVAKITPCFQNGKAVVMDGLPGGVGAGTTELHVLRPHAGVIDPRFALLIFKSPKFVEGGVSTFTGTAGQQRVSADYFCLTPFGLPPLAEQKRIVAKVNELMALCDRLESQQKERDAKHAVLARAALARFAEVPTPASLEYIFHAAYMIDPDDLRKAILRQAFLGRIVVYPKEPEAADIRWTRMLIEHRRLNQREGRQYHVPAPISDQTLPLLPPPFAWLPLEVACPTIVDSPHRTPTYSVDGKYPALRPRDVVGGKLRIDKALRVGDVEFEKQTERRQPMPGDIVYSRELSFGWAVILPDAPAVCLSQGMMSARPSSDVDVIYLRLVLNSPIVRGQAEAAAIGAAHPHVNLKDIRRFAIPLPSLAEQRRIVSKVGQLMALVDQLEAQLTESKTLAGRLMRAVVAELTQPAVREATVNANKWSEPADTASPVIMKRKAATADLFGIPSRSEHYLRYGTTVAALVMPRIGKGHGKTFIEKTLHLVESFCDVPMGRNPRRMAHGPADLKQHDAIMEWAAEADIFLNEPSDQGQRVGYTRGDAFDSFVADAGRVLGEKLASVENLIAKLRPLSSRNVEWVATAYGSWNDFIKDGVAEPTDDEIIKDIYTHWHISKRDVAEKDWRWALNWLRDRNVIPTGKGPRVAGP